MAGSSGLLLRAEDTFVINVDKLTYAADHESVAREAEGANYHFEQADICDAPKIDALLKRFAARRDHASGSGIPRRPFD